MAFMAQSLTRFHSLSFLLFLFTPGSIEESQYSIRFGNLTGIGYKSPTVFWVRQNLTKLTKMISFFKTPVTPGTSWIVIYKIWKLKWNWIKCFTVFLGETKFDQIDKFFRDPYQTWKFVNSRVQIQYLEIWKKLV